MSWPRRFPPSVRARIERGDRALCYAVDDAGTPVIATAGALLLPGGERLRWRHIELVRWDDPTLSITEESGATHTVQLAEPGALPDVAYERVTSTIVVSGHVPLSGRLGVRIVARREPGNTGAPDDNDLDWRLHFDAGLDPADPGTAAAANRALAQLRAAYL